MYGIQDVCTLNIIRALRELKIPTRAIRTYLERRSVGETLSLLDREEALLRRRMAELEAALEEARARRARLEQYRAAEDGRVFFRREEARPYVFLEEDIILEKEIDFLLKKLEHRHQDYLKIIGSQCMGAAVDEEWLSRGVYNHFSRVFFLTEPGLPHDDALPAGEYACLYYRGAYDRLEEHCGVLLAGIAAAGRRPAGRPWSCTGWTPTTPTGRRSTSPSCKCGWNNKTVPRRSHPARDSFIGSKAVQRHRAVVGALLDRFHHRVIPVGVVDLDVERLPHLPAQQGLPQRGLLADKAVEGVLPHGGDHLVHLGVPLVLQKDGDSVVELPPRRWPRRRGAPRRS